MTWGIVNLWKEGKEGTYAVQHGQKPVNDFGRVQQSNRPASEEGNLFERAFPCLFPYGCGGIEGEQPARLDFQDHVQWALHYHDRRFHVHESFAFVAFGIIQRWQALFST